jgi:DNA-binding transcriptional ArsR family regulator
VLDKGVIAEIRRRHFVGNEKISALAKAFGLSHPTIRKHLKTVAEPVYLRKHEPHTKLGLFHGQLDAWLE